jgi:rhodanese-related sulfurtransferase
MTPLVDLPAPDAYTFLQEHPNAVLIDVRSTVEHQFVGHPIGAVHIPWSDGLNWQRNENFVHDIEQYLTTQFPGFDTKQHPVVLMCRSGARTEKAGAALIEAGFSNVSHVSDGFEGDKDQNQHRGNINGWRFHNLPWQQS